MNATETPPTSSTRSLPRTARFGSRCAPTRGSTARAIEHNSPHRGCNDRRHPRVFRHYGGRCLPARRARRHCGAKTAGRRRGTVHRARMLGSAQTAVVAQRDEARRSSRACAKRLMCADKLHNASSTAAHPRARAEARLEPQRSEVAAVVVHLLCRGPAAPRTAPPPPVRSRRPRPRGHPENRLTRPVRPRAGVQ